MALATNMEPSKLLMTLLLLSASQISSENWKPNPKPSQNGVASWIPETSLQALEKFRQQEQEIEKEKVPEIVELPVIGDNQLAGFGNNDQLASNQLAWSQMDPKAHAQNEQDHHPEDEEEHAKLDHDHECYDCVLCCIDKLERTLKLISELQELNKLLFLTVPRPILKRERIGSAKNEVPEYAQGQARAYIGKRENNE